MCSVPVTFGGGSRMQYGSPLPVRLEHAAGFPAGIPLGLDLGGFETLFHELGFGIGDSGFD